MLQWTDDDVTYPTSDRVNKYVVERPKKKKLDDRKKDDRTQCQTNNLFSESNPANRHTTMPSLRFYIICIRCVQCTSAFYRSRYEEDAA